MRPAARWLPGGARRLAASVWCEWTGLAVERELGRMAAGTRPIIVGPWLGEVGFELLYWLPFLEWAVERFAIEPARLVVVSRGGTGAWYRRLASRYRDVFEFLEPDEFRCRNEARAGEVGEQKQVRVTGLEQDIAGRVALALGMDDPWLLHPQLMYRAFAPYWWGHADLGWVHRHARFRRLPDVARDERPAGLPEHYVAVKFYHNDAFPPTAANRAVAERIVTTLAQEGPVVSLATGLRLDDHAALEEEARHAQHGMAGASAATNLGTQNAIIAGASSWVGTYGGFAYLAPFHGVPARSYYSNPDGFSRRHLELACAVFDGFGPGLLSLSDVAGNPGRGAAR